MRRFWYLLGALLLHNLALAQCPDATSKVKSEYWSYIEEFRVSDRAESPMSSCAASRPIFTKVFELGDTKTNQCQFQILPNGKFGHLKDSILLTVTECLGTEATEIYCRYRPIQKPAKGKSDRIEVQIKDMRPEAQYFVAVGAAKGKRTFTVRTTENFRPIESILCHGTGYSNPMANVVVGVLYSQDGNPLAGASISLLDEQDVVIDSTVTDAMGGFRFEKLPMDQCYMARIEEMDEPVIANILAYDSHGDVVMKSHATGDNTFKLARDKAPLPPLQLLAASDYAVYTAAGTFAVMGKLVDKDTRIRGRKNMDVYLVKDEEEVGRTQTDEHGNFYFDNLADVDYQIRIDPSQDVYAEMVIVDDNNMPVLAANSDLMNSDGTFAFQRLPREEVELSRENVVERLSIDLSGLHTMSAGDKVILDEIRFETGSADLRPESRETLDNLSDWLKNNKGIRIQVTDHTDNVGSEEVNMALSQSRAQAVCDYLKSKGVSASQLIAVGKGSSEPLVSNHSERGRMLNRRVEIMRL